MKYPFKCFDGETATGTVTVWSTPVNLSDCKNASFDVQLVGTGTTFATGTLAFVAYNKSGSINTQLTTATIYAGGANTAVGSTLVSFKDCSYAYIQMSYTNVAGTGKLTAYAVAKGV
jgi:hypothetical protein